MRGPLASKVLNQLLLATDWGKMDYLIIDMPPGTGDIQITLTQSVQMSGAVVVTTPHRLALVDAAKGVAMFDQVNVPVISVVENMAYFVCRHGEKYFPFGCGGKEKLLAELSKQSSADGDNDADTESHGWPYHQVPLTMEGSGLQMDESSSPNYVNLPAVISAPSSETAGAYKSLADSVIDQLFKQQTEASMVSSAFSSLRTNENFATSHFILCSLLDSGRIS
jgi:Mrp family chromosome partitioning ATPase